MSDVTGEWTPERIRAAIRERGISQAALAREYGLNESAVRNAISPRAIGRTFPAAEELISNFLGVPLHELWPSRYHPDGRSKTVRKRPRNPSALTYPPHRQNRSVA